MGDRTVSSLLTNTASMQALRVLQSMDGALSNTQNQIATGLKVANAKQNSAIWSVSFAIKSDVSVLHMVQDGLSRLDSELGMINAATEKVATLLDEARARAVSLEEATSEQARQSIRSDILARVEQAEEIIGSASFNGASLLDGSKRRVVTGADGETMLIGGHQMDAATLGLDAIRAKLDAVAPETVTRSSGTNAETGREIFGNDALSLGSNTTGAGGGDGITGAISATSAVKLADGASDFVKMLVYGTKWGGAAGSAGTTLTWSLYTGADGYSGSYGNGEPASPAVVLNGAYQGATRQIFEYASGITGNVFQEVVEDGSGTVGDFRFAGYTDAAPTATAHAYLPGDYAEAGDMWISTNIIGTDAAPTKGDYSYMTILHELGHALGLKHPHEENIDGEYNYDGNAFDHMKYSIMSYKDFAGDTNDGYGASFYATSFMVADIAALQAMYGVGAGNSDDTTYSWSGQTFETLWDGGGVDTIDLSNKTTALDIDLTPGSYSNVGTTVTFEGTVTESYTMGIAYGTIIENVVGGSGNDTIKGNDADNVFTGGAGADSIDGGAGWNVAVFSGNKADYTIADMGDGTVRVTGRDGRDTLSNIQELRFDDGSVDISDLAPPLTAAEYEAQQNGDYTISLGYDLHEMIDIAQQRVVDVGAAYGSEAGRIETAQVINAARIEELTRAVGVMVDADMTEVAARNQALQVQAQLARQTLSIANSSAQTLLQLFR